LTAAQSVQLPEHTSMHRTVTDTTSKDQKTHWI